MPTLPTRFARNTIANYSGTVVSVLLALVITPILVRGLGQEAYGTWVLVTTSVLYLDILQFGFGRAVVRFVAQALARGDTARVRGVTATAFYTLAVPGVLLVVAAPALAWLFPRVFEIPDSLRTAAMVLVVLSAIDLAVGIPSDSFGAGLIGYQRYDLLNVTVIATGVGQTLAWLVLLGLGGGVVAIGVATLVFSVASQLARFLLLWRLVGAFPVPPDAYDRSLVRKLTTMSGWIAVTDIGDIVLGRIDVAVVGIVVGVPQAGIYAVGQKLTQLAQKLTSPVLTVFYPHAAGLDAADDREELKGVLYLGTRISLALAIPVTIAVATLAGPLIQAWVGDGFAEAGPVAVYLSATFVVLMFSKPGVYVLRGMGEVRGPALLVILEALINLTLSIVLGRAMGLEGVALGSFLAALIAQTIGFPWICWKIGASGPRLFALLVARNAPAAAVALVTGLWLRSLAIDGLVLALAGSAAVVGAFFAVFALTGLSRLERRAVRERIRRPGQGTAPQP